jgi:anti-sigma factor ChrR (cupin superfamily)
LDFGLVDEEDVATIHSFLLLSASFCLRVYFIRAIPMTELLNQTFILKDLPNIATWQNNLPWQPFRDGVEIYRLYGDNTSGPAAALLRYEPGASVPMHAHTGFEHIYVLTGSQTDQNGEHQAGTFVINPPNSNHSVVSQAGCIVLVIWEKPISLWS